MIRVHALIMVLAARLTCGDASANECHTDVFGDLRAVLSAIPGGARVWPEIPYCRALKVNTIDRSLWFELADDSPYVHGGRRAEIGIDARFWSRETSQYSYEVFVPEMYPITMDARWWAISQWHDQPDPRVGQSWTNFPKRPPVISVHLRRTSDTTLLELRREDQGVVCRFAVREERWTRVSYEVHWSTANDGWVRMNVAGGAECVSPGRTMYADYPNYFKLSLIHI